MAVGVSHHADISACHVMVCCNSCQRVQSAILTLFEEKDPDEEVEEVEDRRLALRFFRRKGSDLLCLPLLVSTSSDCATIGVVVDVGLGSF